LPIDLPPDAATLTASVTLPRHPTP
jgi:hypothetical protein